MIEKKMHAEKEIWGQYPRMDRHKTEQNPAKNSELRGIEGASCQVNCGLSLLTRKLYIYIYIYIWA